MSLKDQKFTSLILKQRQINKGKYLDATTFFCFSKTGSTQATSTDWDDMTRTLMSSGTSSSSSSEMTTGHVRGYLNKRICPIIINKNDNIEIYII